MIPNPKVYGQHKYEPMNYQNSSKKKGHEAKEGKEAGADLREIMGTHGMNMIKMYENFKDRYKYC